MDNNFALTRYIQDEYISSTVSGHNINQQERQNLTKEFFSALKIGSKSDNNANLIDAFLFLAMTIKLPGLF